MKSAVALLCVWALAVAVAVHAQQRCPLTAQDLSSLDYSQVNSACAGLSNPPSAGICDSCSAALLLAFAPTYSKFGLTAANPPANANAFANALQQSITVCFNVAYPVLSQKVTAVPVTALVDLRNCPQTPGPKVTAAYEQLFPNAPVQANSG